MGNGCRRRNSFKTLEKAGDIIDGVTCGAGMPYKLSEIAAKFGIYYYPIVSSARAFNALWKDPTEKHQIIWRSCLRGSMARRWTQWTLE